MWIGFIIIISGIFLYIFGPVLNIETSNDVKILTIGSGVVVEIVSALFLFIYTQSKKSSKYFYERQIFIHNALLAHRMSKSMSNPDDAKMKVIEKLVSYHVNKDDLNK